MQLFLPPLSVCLCVGGGHKIIESSGAGVRSGCQLPVVEALVAKLKSSRRVASVLSD